MRDGIDCELCQKTWAMYGKQPNCEDCRPIQLLPQNEVVFKLYLICRNQWILAGMDGTPLDVDIQAILATMDLYGVGSNKRIFERLLSLIRSDIQEIKEKRNNK